MESETGECINADAATTEEPSSSKESINTDEETTTADRAQEDAPQTLSSQELAFTHTEDAGQGCDDHQFAETLARRDFRIKQQCGATTSPILPTDDEISRGQSTITDNTLAVTSLVHQSSRSSTNTPGAVSVLGDLSSHSIQDGSVRQVPLTPVDRDSFRRGHSIGFGIEMVTITDTECFMEQANPTQNTQGNSSNNSSQNDADEILVEATAVEATSLATAKAMEPTVVAGFNRKQLMYVGGFFLFLVGVMAVVILALTKDNNASAIEAPTAAPTADPTPTLERIRDRDLLRCGIWEEAVAFLALTGTYKRQEDQVDFILCRAYAAAILGNASKHEIVFTTQKDDFLQLQGGNVDMVVSHTFTTMQRDVWEFDGGVNTGFTFSVPYAYTDLVYGGLPEYVACAEDDLNTLGNCSGLRICTNFNTGYFDAIVDKIPERFLIKRNSTLDNVLGFVEGACNVVPAENSGVMEWGLDFLGYQGEFVRGEELFQRDVATIATRDNDPEFSDFVNIILMGIFAAEINNVTKETADTMRGAGVLGENIAQAIKTVGSYKDVYETGIAPFLSRKSWNLLNNGTTGLLFPFLPGKVRVTGPGPVVGGTLQSIAERKSRKIHCGIQLNYPGFASLDDEEELVGIDVDYCKMLAASVLGDPNAVDFIPLLDKVHGYQMLNDGEVDVLTGFEWNIVDDYREPTTTVGYSFSQPYFYSPVTVQANNATNLTFGGENRCLVTRQDDSQFSSFVFWVAAAPVYAEEQGISQVTANGMPDVHLFSKTYLHMLRDAVYFAGNYTQIYDRNLKGLLAERGRNALNTIVAPGPQIYAAPGYHRT